jgi:two-component system OmpR family response regulator
MVTRAPSATLVPTERPARTRTPRVLVVGPDVATSEEVRTVLESRDCAVLLASTVTDAVVAAAEFRPDLAVLDLDPPEWGGLEVLGALRSQQHPVPALLLTDGDEGSGHLFGLAAGDLHLRKPVSPAQLLARLNTMMPKTDGAHEVLTVGDLQLDASTHLAHRGADDIHLTATEFALLAFLMRNPRHVLSKAQILDRVWDHDLGGQANLVELYISYLRKKIDAGRTPMIHTVRGFGYVLKPAG